jgi:transposase
MVCFMGDTGEVFKVEVYARVRRAVQVDGMSIRQAAREFGLARKTIRKMLAYSRRAMSERSQLKRPKLGPWLGIIDQILEDDKSQPKKQRHTAKRIWDRLKVEHSFGGGYTVVKDYVRGARLQRKEVFVQLVHPPGDAQMDFGEALEVVGGVEQKAHFLRGTACNAPMRPESQRTPYTAMIGHEREREPDWADLGQVHRLVESHVDRGLGGARGEDVGRDGRGAARESDRSSDDDNN